MKPLLFRMAMYSLGLSCGCSPSLAWYGHTPDRTERIEVRQRNKMQWLAMGERESPKFDAFGTDAFAFALGGRHVAVAAVRIGKDGVSRWHVVRDFKEGARWDGLAGLVYSPNGKHLAYAGVRNGRWHLVVDEKPGPAFDTIEPDTIAWSLNGERLGVVAQDGPCARAVIDSQIGACFRRIIGVSVGQTPASDIVLAVFPSDGRAHLLVGGTEKANMAVATSLSVDDSREHWAVLAMTEPPEEGMRVLVDEKAQPVVDQIVKFVWAPKGSSFAYVARRGKTHVVVEGARTSREYDSAETPVFSEDGAHVGHIGHASRRGFVTIDGHVLWSEELPVTALVLDRSGKRRAFMYRDTKGPVIAVDDARYRYDVVIDGSLRFSRDGQHWAALVGSLAESKLRLIMDGQTQLPFESEELFGGGLYRNTPDPIGTWVSGELELYLRGHHGSK